MDNSLKVVCSIGIIGGGGIVGVAAAIAVAKTGHHARMFEQAMELREVRTHLFPAIRYVE